MEHGISNPERETESVYPKGLQTIVHLFESLPDQEKRDALISYADQARKWEPREGETFNLEDIRKDEECTDTVGVFLMVGEEERATFRVTLGPQVQTLTRTGTVDGYGGFRSAERLCNQNRWWRTDPGSQSDRILRADPNERDLQSL